MANLAKEARDKAQATWPGASVNGRGQNWIQHQHPTDETRFIVDSHIGPIHYGANNEIDTAWQADTTDGFTHAMTANDFITRVRADQFNAGNIFRFEKDGETLSFDPQSINWIDENTSRQQIAIKQNVAGALSDDIVSFPAAYGAGIDFQYQNQNTRLQKLITIDALTDLPPATVQGNEIWFEAEFSLSTSSGINYWIDGVEWARSNRVRVQTANQIEVRNSAGDTVLWWLSAARAWDSSDNNETAGQLEVRRQGGKNSLFITVRIPKPWIDAATFPIYIDPTIDDSVSANGDDGYRSSGVWTTSSYVGYVGEGPGLGDAKFYARFTTISGLSGATITTSYFEPRFSNNGSAVKTLIFANDVAAPTTPSTGGGYDGLAKTTASVAWDDATSSDVFTQSPSINSVIQEIADSHDPSAIAIMWENNSSAASNWHNVRTHENASSWAAKLHIEYTTGGAATISLSTLTLAGSSVALSVGAGAVAALLNSLTLAGSVVALSVTAGAVSVLLNSLTLAGNAESLTVIPGAISTLLNTLTLAGSVESLTVTLAQIISLLSLTLAGSIESLTVIPGAISAALNTLTLAGNVEALSVIPGAIITALNTLTLAASIESLSAIIGGVSVLLSSLTLAGSVPSLTVITGAVSVLLGTLTLAGSAETLAVSIGIIVALSSLTLAGSIPALTVIPGAIAVLLNSLTLAGNAETLAVVPGSVSALLNTLTLAGGVEALTVDISIVIALATLTLAGSAEALSVVPGAIAVTLNSLTLAGSMQSLTITSGILAIITSCGFIYSPANVGIVQSPSNEGAASSPRNEGAITVDRC